MPTYTDTSGRILSEIQRHLLETTIDEGATWSLWTQAEVLAYLNRRISRFRKETGITVTTASLTGGVTGPTFDLPADLIAVKHVWWVDGVGDFHPLVPMDKWTADHSFPGWIAS